jgi:phosphohistidine phosphatase
MRTLLLLRHAKSSWDDPELDDHERPLNKRGTRDASHMGELIGERGLAPDAVLCSDAVRTRATLTLVLAAAGARPARIQIQPRLYLAEPPAIIELVRALPAECQRCLVVGHNPGIHALALGLTGSGERKALAALAIKFPTGGLAVIDLDVEGWGDVRPGAGALRLFTSPKDL